MSLDGLAEGGNRAHRAHYFPGTASLGGGAQILPIVPILPGRWWHGSCSCQQTGCLFSIDRYISSGGEITTPCDKLTSTLRKKEIGVLGMKQKGNGASLHKDTLIGPNTIFEGTINTDNSITVEGRVHGKIEAEGEVVVGRDGKVGADIHAGSVVVGGQVIGNIVARRRLEITETGRVKGDIEAAAIKVSEGGKVEGSIKMMEEAQPELSGVPMVISFLGKKAS